MTLAVVVAIHALLLFLLLRLAPPPFLTLGPKAPITITLIPQGERAPESSEASAAERPRQQQRQARSRPAPLPPPPLPPAAVEPPEPQTSSIWSRVIPMTRQQLAAADTVLRESPRSAPGETAASDASAASGSGSGDPGPGSGPNGEPLYNAQWYRRPTAAELAYYLPRGVPPVGWGMIACQTVARYRVDNCHEVAQSPEGSGLSRAVLQAAWQFRVMPPRIGGRTMVGAWVRIRIEYSEIDGG